MKKEFPIGCSNSVASVVKRFKIAHKGKTDGIRRGFGSNFTSGSTKMSSRNMMSETRQKQQFCIFFPLLFGDKIQTQILSLFHIVNHTGLTYRTIYDPISFVTIHNDRAVTYAKEINPLSCCGRRVHREERVPTNTASIVYVTIFP